MHLALGEINFLVCPIDQKPLRAEGSSFKCESGHSYDVSKSGYINLLAVQFKASKDPGDNKAMILARSHVHQQEVFEPLALMLNGYIDDALKESDLTRPLLIDAGCGEGYYTRKYLESSSNANVTDTWVVGLDISKWAINDAAKKSRQQNTDSKTVWLVGSNNNLPVEKGLAPVIMSIFGFESWKHWYEHQSAQQSVLVIKSGPQHLIELRGLIYKDVIIKNVVPDSEALAAGYTVAKEESLSYVVEMNNADELNNILAMTPHGKKRNIYGEQQLTDDFPFKVTIDVAMLHYRKV